MADASARANADYRGLQRWLFISLTVRLGMLTTLQRLRPFIIRESRLLNIVKKHASQSFLQFKLLCNSKIISYFVVVSIVNPCCTHDNTIIV